MNRKLRNYGRADYLRRRTSRWKFLIILSIVIVIITIGKKIHLLPNEIAATNGISTMPPTLPPGIALPIAPANWQSYVSPDGFALRYPQDWTVDDSYLTSHSTLHDATINHANHITLYGTQAAESDPTKGPSLTLTITPLTDEQNILHANFSTAREWVASSITGLPKGSAISDLSLLGSTSVRLTGLAVLKGSYQAVYIVNTGQKMVARLDYTYSLLSDVTLLDQIAGSFTM